MTPLPDPEALAALRAGGVDDALAERLAVYAALVLAANRRVNLTGARDGAAFAAHILDALTLRGDVVSPLDRCRIGQRPSRHPAGAGDRRRRRLLEPIKKRASFLREALDMLGIAGSASPPCRGCRARSGVPRALATATARAVGGAPTVAELTVPLLAIGGRALLQRGSLDPRERNAVADAALVLGAELVEERAARRRAPDPRAGEADADEPPLSAQERRPGQTPAVHAAVG